MIPYALIFFLVKFGIQTVFLTAALWIMIKLQKLNYNFPGLLGSAALVSGLDRILEVTLGHFLGIYLVSTISTPIVVTVLFICVSKVTQADRVDVMYTIVVGYALMFGMNLWLIGALIGDLRPSARAHEEFETAPLPQHQLQLVTNQVAQTVIKTNLPVPNAPAKLPAQLNPEQRVEVTTNLFSVKGVAQSGSRSAVTIQVGKRTYTIMLGEAALTQTANGPVLVRFKQLGDGWVVLAIDEKEIKLPLSQTTP